MTKIIGIICEYNPLHNGHIYHINKIKEMFPDSIIILVTNGYFSQRGEINILNKLDKINSSLNHNIDLIVELPFVFATQSADIFASGAIQILNTLNIDTLVFGSEINNIETLKKIATIQDSTKYNNLLKEFLDKGINYPTAISKAISKLTNKNINTPNDLLGISYIKAIKHLNSNIEAISIKRTNDYHSLNSDNRIISGTAIRNLIKENKNINDFVPKDIFDLNLKYIDLNNYFDLLKYKILCEKENINKYQTVDEGIENRILKYISKCNNTDDLISVIKTKRYTYNKICRMFIHILCSFTKEEANRNKKIEYIRILGFNNNGQKYLNKIKKNVSIPIISKLGKQEFEQLLIEKRVTDIYNLKSNIIINEYKEIPIRK